MSKTLARLRSSSGVSRSNSRVASPARFNTSATYRLRGLWRLLPLPCANTTIPVGVLGDREMPGHRHRSGGHLDFLIAQRRVGRADAGDAVPETVAGPIEQRDHLVVGGLGEVAVTLADGEEERGRLQAHHLVGVPGEPRDDIVRADRNRQHHPARAPGAGDLAGRLGGRAGRDAVIDDHRDPPRQRDPVDARGGTVPSGVAARPAARLRPRPCRRRSRCASRTTESLITRTSPSPMAPKASSG